MPMTSLSPASPAPSGYSWRPLRLADAPALAALEGACATVDRNPTPRTVADWQARLGKARAALVADSLCACDAAGQMIASAWVTFDDRLAHEYRVYLDGMVHPAYRGQGLGSFILPWMEARGRQGCTRVNDGRACVLRIDFYHQGETALALFERYGYALAMAEDEMRRDLRQPIPNAPLPAGLAFVPWSEERAPFFFSVYDDAFRERPGFPGWSEAVWRRAFTGYPEFRADLSLLVVPARPARGLFGLPPRATEPPAGVGFAVCALEAGADDVAEGWIVQMGVRPAWRKRGLGAAVLCEAMRRFRGQGAGRAVLTVNVNNPAAAALYRNQGFELYRRYTSYRKQV